MLRACWLQYPPRCTIRFCSLPWIIQVSLIATSQSHRGWPSDLVFATPATFRARPGIFCARLRYRGVRHRGRAMCVECLLICAFPKPSRFCRRVRPRKCCAAISTRMSDPATNPTQQHLPRNRGWKAIRSQRRKLADGYKASQGNGVSRSWISISGRQEEGGRNAGDFTTQELTRFVFSPFSCRRLLEVGLGSATNVRQRPHLLHRTACRLACPLGPRRTI